MSKNTNIKFSEVNAVDEFSVQNAVGSDVFDAAILTIGISPKFTAFEDFEDFKRTIEINFFGNIVPIRILVRNKLIKNKKPTLKKDGQKIYQCTCCKKKKTPI